MGLPRAGETEVENLTKRFSDDVLKIELSGPEYHHLSVVDVPGLFHSKSAAYQCVPSLTAGIPHHLSD